MRWGRRKITTMVAASLFVTVNSNAQDTHLTVHQGTHAPNGYVTTLHNKERRSEDCSLRRRPATRDLPICPPEYKLTILYDPPRQQPFPTQPGAGVSHPHQAPAKMTKMIPVALTAPTIISITLALVAAAVVCSRFKGKPRSSNSHVRPATYKHKHKETPRSGGGKNNSLRPVTKGSNDEPAQQPPDTWNQQEKPREASMPPRPRQPLTQETYRSRQEYVLQEMEK